MTVRGNPSLLLGLHLAKLKHAALNKQKCLPKPPAIDPCHRMSWWGVRSGIESLAITRGIVSGRSTTRDTPIRRPAARIFSLSTESLTERIAPFSTKYPLLGGCFLA